MVERSNLVQNVQVHASPCLKILFCMHFIALASKSKSRKCTAYVRESCEENKNNPVPRVVLNKSQEQSSFGTRHSRAMMGGCLLAPLLLFSFLFLPSFSFLSPPLLSLRCVFKNSDLGKDAPGRQSYGWYGRHLGSIRGLGTRMKHLCCNQKRQNRSPGEVKTQNQQNLLNLQN